LCHELVSARDGNLLATKKLWHSHSMNSAETRKLIAVIQTVVRDRDDLRAMAICGSWARGNPRPDSDLDLLIIAEDPDSLHRRQNWIREFKFSDAGFEYVNHKTARYGVVWSAHIELKPDAELELTFGGESWASVDPTDPGTLDVVRDAFTILVDKDGVLQRLCGACL
jgi:hypothetical protein